MSFSMMVKGELCRIDEQTEISQKALLTGILHAGLSIKKDANDNYHAIILTENAALSRIIYKLFKSLYKNIPEVLIEKSNKFKRHVAYILDFSKKGNYDELLRILNDLGINLNKKDLSIEYNENFCVNNEFQRVYLRGIFLVSGSVSHPDKSYHLEMTFHNERVCDTVLEMLKEYDLNAKTIKRKGNKVVYLKEGQNIVDFFNIIGAHNALMEYENVRIMKEMRNNVNRIVNCETANVEKTVNASIRQINNIKYIKEKIGFEKLPDNLKQVAVLRLEYAEASLSELAKMTRPPIGRSGVNHRIRKLEKIAEELRERS